MSRIGKKSILLPKGITAEITNSTVTVKGSKGEHVVALHPEAQVQLVDGTLTVNVKHPEVKEARSVWGSTRALLANAVKGVQEPFQKKLEMVGVGFRGAVQGKKLSLEVGFSHDVEIDIPEGLTCSVEKNMLTITGIDKQKVGAFGAQLRSIRKPEPYKGKGIKYEGEVIRRKAGKAAKAAGGTA
ncbi:50S ribosomal protein L6 [Candidatus Uhrbacteria bacterium]|nr:50S ribosomal protein L6 [Candidatus Uhrbacteria bacterium]